VLPDFIRSGASGTKNCSWPTYANASPSRPEPGHVRLQVLRAHRHPVQLRVQHRQLPAARRHAPFSPPGRTVVTASPAIPCSPPAGSRPIRPKQAKSCTEQSMQRLIIKSHARTTSTIRPASWRRKRAERRPCVSTYHGGDHNDSHDDAIW
jgi:hypothetical protein